jgi:hypothetical protein
VLAGGACEMHEVDLTSRRAEELDRFLQPLSKGHVIVEERMYMLYVGKVPELMEVHEREGLPILRKLLGHPVGF